MGKQEPGRTQIIVDGIIDGCEQAECALIGGEMAEMPGMYKPGDFDLAGFAVGFAKSKNHLILGQDTRPKMWVYGLPSTGLHSNGYSLARRVFGLNTARPKTAKTILERYYPELHTTLGEELLKPTAIYVKLVKQLLKNHDITGMANITGGGLIENPPRMLPDNCHIVFDDYSWPVPPIFTLIQEKGNVPPREMLRTFNNGIGLVFVSPDDNIKDALLIGKVVERKKGEKKIRFRQPPQ